MCKCLWRTYLFILLDRVGEGFLQDGDLIAEGEDFVEACFTLTQLLFLRRGRS